MEPDGRGDSRHGGDLAASPAITPGADYGFKAGWKLHPCSREDLIRRCSRDEVPPIGLVWTPEVPGLVPPEEVQFLQEALRKRAIGRIKLHLFLGCFFVLGSGGGLLAFRKEGWGKTSAFLLLNLIVLGVLPVVQAFQELRRIRRGRPAPAVIPLLPAGAVERRRNIVTWGIVACLGAVALCEVVFGLNASIARAGLIKDEVRHGETWRLFTGPLLHGGLLHFVMNGSTLITLGFAIEMLAHSAYLPAVFLASMASGSIASQLLLPTENSVGASGGLLGLIGFLAVLGFRKKATLPPGFLRSIFLSIGQIALLGLVAWPIIDNAAHFGGLLGGAAFGLCLGRRAFASLPMRPGVLAKSAGLASFLAILAATVLAIAKIAHR